MNATYSETTRLGKTDMPLLQHATACLEDILRKSAFADEVQAEWQRGEDEKGRTLYTLRLSAWELSASASFTPRDLRDNWEVRWSLLTLWDNLLRLGNERSLKNLSKGNDDA
jgi:hypothetical protein